MYCYQRLLRESRSLNARPATAEEAAELLRGIEIKFFSNDRAVRLPAKAPAVLDALQTLPGTELPLAVEVIRSPTFRIPLTSSYAAQSGERSVAVGAHLTDGSRSALVIAELRLREVKNKFAPLAELALELSVLEDDPAALTHLEILFARTPPPARIVFPRSDTDASVSVAWVGGTPDGVSMPYEGADALRAAAAVRGAQLTFYANPRRLSKEILQSLKQEPPDVLVLWEPYAERSETISEFAEADTEMQVLRVPGRSFDDAVEDLRVFLEVMNLDAAPSATPPANGEARFYIKVGGSKVGDRMIHVSDCAHDKWGDDARSKAPRALKGIEAFEGTRPTHLSLCSKCTKHRWRARF